MKILFRGLLLIAIPTVFQLTFLVMLLQAQSNAAYWEKWASHSKDVIEQLTSAEEPVLREAADLRLAVIADDRRLHGGDQFWKDLDQRMSALAESVSDNQDQVRRVHAIDAEIVKYHAWNAMIDQKLAAGAHADAVTAVRSGTGNELLSSVTARMGEFLSGERYLDAQRMAGAAAARSRQQIVLLCSGVFALLAGAGAVYLFSRSIAGRLLVVTRNAARLGEGTALDAPVKGRDEIALLDQAVHETARRLALTDEAKRRLQEELRVRAEELTKVNENLRQQTQENELFVYSVSHDLRSPLVNLQGFGKELGHACEDLKSAVEGSGLGAEKKDRIDEILEKDVGVSLRYLQTAVARAAAIIDALLRLSRAGRVEYQRKEVDVNAVARRVVEAMQGTIREKGASVTVGEMKPAEGDSTAIEQILANYAVNALNYLDPGRSGRIEVGCRPAVNGMNIYFVKDNGMGIPKAYMGKVFTAFQRLHGSAIKGEGIGLALVRRMAERQGGKTWVESEEGVGSTFFVSLPAWNKSKHSSNG